MPRRWRAHGALQTRLSLRFERLPSYTYCELRRWKGFSEDSDFGLRDSSAPEKVWRAALFHDKPERAKRGAHRSAF